MEEEFDIEKLKNISERLRQINSKFRLLTLLKNAKEEYDKNNYEECITNCLEALEHDPENPVALRGMGCSMQFLGNRDEALRYYNLALKFIQETITGCKFNPRCDLAEKGLCDTTLPELKEKAQKHFAACLKI